MSVKIDRYQRDIIYEIATTDLSGIGDIAIEIDAGRFPEAQILRSRYFAELRLLDNLGWDPDEDRELFELTIEKETLLPLLERYHHHYAELLTQPAHDDPEKMKQEKNTLLVLHNLALEIAATAG